MSAPNGFIVCPYDKTHILLANRFLTHLLRCKRNHPNSNLIQCPFNTTHLLEPNKFLEHTLTCPHREQYEIQMNAVNSPPPQLKYYAGLSSSEDWDDNDPQNDSYNSEINCKEIFMYEVSNGASKAIRKKIRDERRKYFRITNMIENHVCSFNAVYSATSYETNKLDANEKSGSGPAGTDQKYTALMSWCPNRSPTSFKDFKQQWSDDCDDLS